MSEALINSEVLRWTRERARLEPEYVAEKAHVKLEKLMLWEQGDKRPSFLQAQKLAKVLHIPFGYLFLQQPPQEALPIPDLRTVGDHQTHEITPISAMYSPMFCASRIGIGITCWIAALNLCSLSVVSILLRL